MSEKANKVFRFLMKLARIGAVCSILFIVISIACLFIIGMEPRYSDELSYHDLTSEIEENCILDFCEDIDDNNIIDQDEYGRILISSGNIAERNSIATQDTVVAYMVLLPSGGYQYFKHLPNVYYLVTCEDNTDTEEFRQFLSDNHWGEELSATIDQYVSFGYPYHLMDRELLDTHEGFKYYDYIDDAYDYVKQNICADIVQLNTIPSYKDYKLMSAYINKDDGNLYVVISDCNDLDNITYSNYLIRYDHFREDLESIKETVDWVNECKIFDKEWNCIYEQCMDAIRTS
ncbi:MAG: hypothetical protein ACI4M5_04315 [Christensenellales bacterium]